MRRNVDLNIILHNNEIYGLTKGQYSPTSPLSKVTKSSPMGAIDYPVKPPAVAIGAEGTFIARSLDGDPHHMVETLKRAADHRGTSFVEIYQNCNIYNDGAFDEFTAKDVRADRMLFLKHGEPMIFGKDNDKGIRLNGLRPEVVELGKDGITEKDILVHDETLEDPTIAFMLSRMEYPEFPVPVGVIRAVKRDTYDFLLEDQVERAMAGAADQDINALLRQGDIWTVE
jgi:2-oxoglutarate ferredoxin oxidoreductase subunit beta